MRCPQCQLYIAYPSETRCRRCGFVVTPSTPSQSDARDIPTSLAPAASSMPAPEASPPGGLPPRVPTREEPRHRRNSLLVVLSILLVLACVAGGWAALIHVSNGQHDNGASSTGTPGLAGGYHTIYQDSLQTGASGWAYGSSCADARDGYHITGSFICFAPVQDTGNVRITVQTEQITGASMALYGIVFRRTFQDSYYLFAIDSDGGWMFSKVVNNTRTDIVPYTQNAAIKSRLHMTNILQVIAQGAHFAVFVNGTQVGQADDSTIALGMVGLTGVDGGATVYSNLLIEVPS